MGHREQSAPSFNKGLMEKACDDWHCCERGSGRTFGVSIAKASNSACEYRGHFLEEVML